MSANIAPKSERLWSGSTAIAEILIRIKLYTVACKKSFIQAIDNHPTLHFLTVSTVLCGADSRSINICEPSQPSLRETGFCPERF